MIASDSDEAGIPSNARRLRATVWNALSAHLYAFLSFQQSPYKQRTLSMLYTFGLFTTSSVHRKFILVLNLSILLANRHRGGNSEIVDMIPGAFRIVIKF